VHWKACALAPVVVPVVAAGDVVDPWAFTELVNMQLLLAASQTSPRRQSKIATHLPPTDELELVAA